MKKLIVALVLIGAVYGMANGAFSLSGDEHLDVVSFQLSGALHDSSSADLFPGGIIGGHGYVYDSALLRIIGGFAGFLYTYDNSSVDMSRGNIAQLYIYKNSNINISGGVCGALRVWDNSTVNISGGVFTLDMCARDNSTIDISGGLLTNNLYARENSIVNISGGSIRNVIAWADSTVNVFAGSISRLYSDNNSSMNISGGAYEYLSANDDSIVNISGGIYSALKVYGNSTIILHGYDFRHGTTGLILEGEHVLDTSGPLSGKWFDGTPWAMSIFNNSPSATIMITSEPMAGVYCTEPIAGDLNNDCQVNSIDLAIMTSNWLSCNLEPQSACWQ